nr:PREDICTED: actin cytoskeleton-regulatory complex protein PAN1-like [Opisthocomus hoazin]
MCRTAIPQASSVPDMDNLFFTSLKARLKVYKNIVDRVDLFCSNCMKASEFWCSKCEEFLCTKCFEAHQRYLKRESHEVKKVVDIRAGSAQDFLEDTRRTDNLSCSNPTHKSQTVSIYCKKCEKALCCVCALLDSQHAPFCDVRSETRRRQEELGTISRELKQKRSIFEATFTALQDEAARLEEAQREMRELIRQRVEQLVRLIRREEEELLAGGCSRRRPETERSLGTWPSAGPGCRRWWSASPGTQHDCPSDDETTLILDLEPPGERCQLHGGLPTRLPAHHKTCAPVSDPSGGRGHVCPDQGGDMSPTQPAPPVLPMQRDKQAEEVSGSAHGDTVPLPRSIQDSLASLREDFSGWTRSNVQQAGELLKISNRLLQAQRRANSHLISVTREIRAMSRSLATIASTVAPLLQPVATPRDPPTAEMEWPSLPSDLLELFPPNTPQQHEPRVPAAAAAPSTTRRPPANPPTSPVLSEPSSPASEGECPRSRHPARSKRGGKPSTRLQKRRKK